MKPTTVLTSSGLKCAGDGVGARLAGLLVDGVDARWALADSALPWPVSKYITLSPERCRGPGATPASWASRSSARLTPKLLLAASVPAMDWNTRSTGAPRSISSMVVVTWASTQDWVGIS